MQHVPVYMLYGERHGELLPEVVHAESIESRSRQHDWAIGTHRHDRFLQILVVRSGRGVAVIDEVEHSFVGPAVIVVPPPSIHSFRFDKDIDGDVVTLMAREVERLFGARAEVADFLTQPVCRGWSARDDSFVRIERALASMLAEWRGYQPFRGAALEPVVSLFLVEVARALADGALRETASVPRAAATVHRFLELVNRSVDARLGLDHYATQLGVTRGHLGRLCRASLGVSALDVVHERLLIEARRELFYSSTPIKAIARRLGFSDAAYFTRWFARRAGMAPSMLRARARAEA